MDKEQLTVDSGQLIVDSSPLSIVNSPLKPGYKLTEVGVIPEDWKVKKVGAICGFIVPGRNKPRNFQGDIPWITTPDLEDGRDVSGSRIGLCISRDEAKNVGSKIVPAGSVLMSCAGELGIVAFTEREIVINQQLHAFIPSTIIDGRYLLNAIRAQKKYIDALATKTAVPYLNKDNCNSIPIALPPLLEQRAIATALSDVDALIGALDQLIAKKRDLKQAAMQQLLTGQTRLPGFHGEWGVKTLGEVATIRDGTHQTPNYVESGVPFYSVEQVTSGDFINTKFISETEHRFLTRSCKIEKGDILMTRIGSIGDCKLIDWEVNASFYVSLALLKIHQGYSAAYIAHYSNTAFFKKEVELHSLQSAIPKKINLGSIANIRIEMPSLPEQAAIATVLTDMDAEITALEQRRDKTRALKQGMMQELLTGRTRLVNNG
jgi:type I restriction enzyme S subunit